MRNREIYVQDPEEFLLLNNGVAKVRDGHSEEELETLRFELRTFICEGQYEQGLIRLLRSYLGSLDKPEQPAAWISGFFGSGKSHLVKMLRYLWVDFEFPDGATARGLTTLSPDVSDLLTELSTEGKRGGGLHAASGTLGSSARGSVRLALLSILFRSLGLPEKYPLARFVLWLKQEGLYKELRDRVEADDRLWDREVRNLTKSPAIARHLLDIDPTLGADIPEVRKLLKAEHPHREDISIEEMVQTMREALAISGAFPCTLIALDEIQQFIGDDSQRTYDVQEVTQACASEFGGKLLFVATGQTALSGTPELAKLTGRFRIQVQLSDADVETVTRKTVLNKKESARPQIDEVLTRNSGEISRHLSDTRFAPKPEDDQHLVDDYPLLPTRRRFWERVLRAVDEAGTQSQLRTQLKVVDEAVKKTADAALGTVVGGDFIYEDLRADLLRSEVLANDIDTRIERLRNEEEDELSARICALAFLIGKLPREEGIDSGLRATAETFTDLLVEDLSAGRAELYNKIKARLEKLEEEGMLMQVEGEYRMQTRVSQEWQNDFRGHYREITNQRERLAANRQSALRQHAGDALDNVRKLRHGQSNENRRVEVFFSRERPAPSGDAIPVWVRDGWQDTEASVESEARAEGTESPLIFVFLPKRDADQLDDAIATVRAAETTIQVRGNVSTQEGREARQAMQTRQHTAEQRKQAALKEILQGARVLLAGGQEYTKASVAEAVEKAATGALERMYPKFDVADHKRWGTVFKQAQNGDANALDAVDHKGNPEDHPVCAAVLKRVQSTTTGKTVRQDLMTSPYGWPQDAIDASLVLLTLTRHVQALQNGQSVDVSDLAHRSIGNTRFRAETVTLKYKQKMEVRHLLSQLVNVTPDEELMAVPMFLERVKELADKASGAPPLPAEPDLPYVREIERCTGNERLAKLHEHKERLLKDTGTWQSRINARQQREPAWQTLQRLLHHGQSLDVMHPVREEAEAIEENRSLLKKNNPAQPLLDKATDLLRTALRELYEEYTKAHRGHLQHLEASSVWQELAEDKRQDLLERFGLDTVPAIEVGTATKLLRTLDEASLDAWQTRIDALPQRFDNVLSEAARALEPATVRVQLESRVLKTKADVNDWVEATQKKLLAEVEDHPIQV